MCSQGATRILTATKPSTAAHTPFHKQTMKQKRSVRASAAAPPPACDRHYSQAAAPSFQFGTCFVRKREMVSAEQ